MKKLLSLLVLIMITGCEVYAWNPTYTAPNAGNMNFYPMMQYQMQKQETLDFANDPEHYSEKREAKDNENKKRTSNFNPNYTPNYGGTYLHPVHPVSMQFTKGDDGTIKIQGIHSNSETIKNVEN